MAIDYTLDLDCEPKRRFGRGGLAERLRYLESLQHELALTREQESRVREVVFELRPVAFHCARCPANHRTREFGCYGRVETPISEEAEEWLAGLLPAALNPPQEAPSELKSQGLWVSRLILRLLEAGVTGKACDGRRPPGRSPLAERKNAVRRAWGSLVRRQRLSSSQLLEALLLRPAVPPALGEALLRALGVWHDGGEAEDGVPEVFYTTPIEGDDEPGVAQLKLLFYALMTASSLNLAVTPEEEPLVPEARRMPVDAEQAEASAGPAPASPTGVVEPEAPADDGGTATEA